MPATIISTVRSHSPAAAVMLAAILVAWVAYAPGISGTAWFDDAANLGGLTEIQDASTATRFVLTGIAGPTGRPLALATFAPQAYAWPDALDVFLRTNILIHLLNGVMVTWMLYLLGLARRQTERQATLVASFSGAIWLLLPVLASSSLFIVQRMTTLSATLVLLGIIVYLYGRRRIAQRPTLALFIMTASLGLGSLLAILAKENGVLLFMFVLAIEATLLERPARISKPYWRSWFAVMLLIPGMILLTYLSTQLPYSEEILYRRGFNGIERLSTQAGILWKYLFLGYFPHVQSLGPFHDHYQVQRNLLDIVTMMSIGAWLAVIAAAVILRRRAPLFAFAVAWFLLGHSLESTTIPLELYFEHRNYLPLIGPTYALIAFMFAEWLPWRRTFIAIATAYGLVLAGVLYSVTSLWGAPAVAVEMWYIYQPKSIRAAEALAEQMESVGSPDVARKLFREVRAWHPNAHHLDLQILLMSCQLEPELDHGATVESLQHKLRSARFSHAVIGLLWGLDYMIKTGRCPKLPHDSVEQLARSVLENPRFNADNVRSNLHFFLAQTSIERGNLDLGAAHARQTLDLMPTAKNLETVVQLLERARMYEAIQQIIAESRSRRPLHPVRAILWDEAIERLQLRLADFDSQGAQLGAPD